MSRNSINALSSAELFSEKVTDRLFDVLRQTYARSTINQIKRSIVSPQFPLTVKCRDSAYTLLEPKLTLSSLIVKTFDKPTVAIELAMLKDPAEPPPKSRRKIGSAASINSDREIVSTDLLGGESRSLILNSSPPSLSDLSQLPPKFMQCLLNEFDNQQSRVEPSYCIDELSLKVNIPPNEKLLAAQTLTLISEYFLILSRLPYLSVKNLEFNVVKSPEDVNPFRLIDSILNFICQRKVEKLAFMHCQWVPLLFQRARIGESSLSGLMELSIKSGSSRMSQIQELILSIARNAPKLCSLQIIFAAAKNEQVFNDGTGILKLLTNFPLLEQFSCSGLVFDHLAPNSFVRLLTECPFLFGLRGLKFIHMTEEDKALRRGIALRFLSIQNYIDNIKKLEHEGYDPQEIEEILTLIEDPLPQKHL